MQLPLPLPPQEQQLAWFIAHPEAVRNAFALLNLLAQMQVEVVTPDAARTLGGNKPTLTISDVNAVAPIPLKLPQPYAAPTGTPSRATFNASETTTAGANYDQTAFQGVIDRLTATRKVLAALIVDLQTTGQAPTA